MAASVRDSASPRRDGPGRTYRGVVIASHVPARRFVPGRRPGEPRIGLDRTGAPGTPAVLMLHGLGADRRMWSPQVAALRTDHDLLIWDSRGHGSSDWAEPFTLESWVGDIDRVLDDQDVARAALIGLSMGGIQAMAYAIARPNRVSALVLANTWAQLTPGDLERKLENLPRRAERIGLEAFAEAYAAGASADPGSAGARDYRESLAAMSLPAYVASAEACFGAKLADQVPSVAAPTLVLWGDQDDRMPRPLSEFLRDQIPGATLVDVPAAGHVSNLENPAFFSAAVRAFLAEQGR